MLQISTKALKAMQSDMAIYLWNFRSCSYGLLGGGGGISFPDSVDVCRNDVEGNTVCMYMYICMYVCMYKLYFNTEISSLQTMLFLRAVHIFNSYSANSSRI